MHSLLCKSCFYVIRESFCHMFFVIRVAASPNFENIGAEIVI